jgi:hypothetical protein
MDEKVYRQSRLCRLMGNPIAFAVVDALSHNKELTPSEIARTVGRSVSCEPRLGVIKIGGGRPL